MSQDLKAIHVLAGWLQVIYEEEIVFEDPLERFRRFVLAGSACACKEAVGDEVGGVSVCKSRPGASLPDTSRVFVFASGQWGVIRRVSVGDDMVGILF